MNIRKRNSNFRISNPITRKPNWMAMFLVVVILAVVYCYFGNDLVVFNQANTDRNALAEATAQQIMFNGELDMQSIQNEMDRINTSIQELEASTDLGEFFAINDLTAEGRQINTRVNNLAIAMIVILVMYLVLNFVRAIWWIARGMNRTKAAQNGKFQKTDS